MNFSYIIFILTFLVFPPLALVISRNVFLGKYQRFLSVLLSLFLLYNVVYFNGFSFYGDYIDYIIFALSYLAFCFLVFSIATNKLAAKAFRILGTSLICLGILNGAVGVLMFLVISQDYESDRTTHFEYSGKKYEVRRYSFGFATLDDTRYTFETYRRYKYLPFEHKIDKTDFFDSKSRVKVAEDNLEILIVKKGSENNLMFKSSDGNCFLKKINSL